MGEGGRGGEGEGRAGEREERKGAFRSVPSFSHSSPLRDEEAETLTVGGGVNEGEDDDGLGRRPAAPRTTTALTYSCPSCPSAFSPTVHNLSLIYSTGSNLHTSNNDIL